jgi:uncharacterized protein YjiS (DUF1127 family)
MRPCYFDFEQTQTRRAKAIAMARPLAWHRPLPPPQPRKGLLELWAAVVTLCRIWRNRIRGRRELAALDARMRRDIGASPSDIAREINKPFWRA